MKKITLALCCLASIAVLVSALWAFTPAPPVQEGDTLDLSETSIAYDLPMADLITQSDLIAIGKCTETRSMWVDRNLVTLATIAVSETMKGDASADLTVVLPGGVDASRKVPIAMTYPGAPRITPSEDVFLFLTHDAEVAGGYVIAGFAQGKFSIVKDENGQDVVSRDMTQVALKGKAGLRRGNVSQLSLSRFKSEVARQLRQR